MTGKDYRDWLQKNQNKIKIPQYKQANLDRLQGPQKRTCMPYFKSCVEFAHRAQQKGGQYKWNGLNSMVFQFMLLLYLQRRQNH